MGPDFTIVSLCCNDDQGNDAGRVRSVHIDDDGDTIELESPYWSDSPYARVFPSVYFETQHVRIGHLRILISGQKDWYGNIFWRGVTMLRCDARRLARYLIQTRGWQAECYPIGSDLLPTSPTPTERPDA